MAYKKFADEFVEFAEKAELSPTGGEILDSQRMFVRTPAKESQIDRIKRIVRQELSLRAHDEGFETWDEANDFEVDDPWDTYHTEETIYERQAMVDEYPLGAQEQREPVSPEPGEEAPASPAPPNEDMEHPASE